MGILGLLLIQPSQIIGVERTHKVPQILLTRLSPKDQTSLISSTFHLDIDEYFEKVPFGGLSDFTILWSRVSSTAGGNSGAGG